MLAIDTATPGAAVALSREGAVAVRPLQWRQAFRETAPFAQALLAEAGLGWVDVDALAVPAGPGSFAGLRIGAALALGLADGRAIPLHAVPTLEAVAEAWAPPDAGRVCALLDARQGRQYAARYARKTDGWRLLAGPDDLEPAEVEALADGAPQVGPDRASPDAGSGATVAAALTRIVVRDPGRHRLATPAALTLIYVRPGARRP
ncbi:MAG: tRNA (adenosine(37)-N6)-threonylcarbamoyltransferase complex dimerization subunit type 1 TsaB [Gemmatimonadota bacterium]